MKALEFFGVRLHPETIQLLRSKKNMSQFVREAVELSIANETAQQNAA
jgi:hypothetical protein